MRIAVVDDDFRVLDKVKTEINHWAEEENKDICAEYYPKARLLLYDLDENLTFDVYLLDVEMDEMDGLTLAKQIRERQKEAYIIFLTSHLKYALQGYAVRAYQYLPKGNLENGLKLILQQVYQEYEEEKDDFFHIQTNSRYERIAYKNIYYVYKDRKNVVFVTEQGSSWCRATLQEIYAVMPHNEFIYVDRAYVVSIKKIDRFQNQELFLTNGDKIPVSRSHMNSVKEEIARYWRKRL